jgi:hypothetical protein
MSENFLGTVQMEENNQGSFTPVDNTQHAVKQSFGNVIHGNLLVANVLQSTPAIIMEADCQASEEFGITYNTFDGKNELPLGSGGLQSPLNEKIQVLVHGEKVEIIAGTSTITVLEDGNITLTKGTTNIQVGSNITMSIQGTQVATFSQSSINFLVPVKMPAGSMVKNKLIAVEGAITQGQPNTQIITTAQP